MIMSTILKALRPLTIAAALMLTAAPAARAAEPTFAATGLVKDAQRYEAQIKATPRTAKKPPREIIVEAAKAMTGATCRSARRHASLHSGRARHSR